MSAEAEKLLALAKDAGLTGELMEKVEACIVDGNFQSIKVTILGFIDGQFDSGQMSEEDAKSLLNRLDLTLEERNEIRQRGYPRLKK